MGYQNILVERNGAVGMITLNRPDVLNALNRDLFRELDATLEEFEADTAIRAIIIGGAGEKAFSAGADIKEMARLAEEGDPTPSDERRADFMWRLGAYPKPTIGAINGLAYGGGALLASCLDIRVGCERSRFRFLGAAYGRTNSTWSLPMQVGWPQAKELLFTGRVVGADEAHRIGLLNHLVSSAELMPKAMEIAGQIAANDPRIVQGIKELLVRGVGVGWEQMHTYEREAVARKLKPPPVKESFRPFLERKGGG